MGLCPPNEVPVEPPVGEITIDDAMTLCAGEPSLRVSLCRQDDFEFACAQDDGRLVLVRHTTDEDGVLVISVLEIDGSPSTATPVVCPSRTIEMAPSQIVCVDGVEYTQVPVMDLASLPPAQLAVLWFNAVGTIVADPTPGAVSVTLGACTVDADIVDCETVESVCVGYQDVSNFATATNADVILEFSLVSGSVYHIAVEDGAFTGLFGLVSSAISSFDGLRIFDDTLAPNPGMRLWTGGISNVTSLLGGRRIEFDYDVAAAPATSCAATVLAENTIAEGLFGGAANTVGFVAFLSMNLVETVETVTRKSLSVNLDPCTIAALTPDGVFVPHVNGCIERTVPGGALVCDSTVQAYNFSDTDLVGFTITANDGNGNYTMIQEQVPTAHAAFLALLQNIAAGNARAVEDIGPGFLLFNWHEGNISNVIDLSPTEVQFDIHAEVGVSDTPAALVAPCTDPVADSVYQSSAAMSRSIYDPVPLNVQQPNGGTAINFVVTSYFATLIPGGDDTVTHIPAKQVVKLVDGLLVETYHVPGDINTEIVFDNATDVFKNVCSTSTEVEYTACDDTIVPVTVDSVVGAYVLNQEYKHTETVYDNITASLGGTINTLITGTNVAFDLTTITATNWIGTLYAIEFGNGYTDVGNNPTFDFANEPDGNYEIKIYRAFAFPEGFRWFLVAPIEIIKTGSTVTVATVNPLPVLRSITYTVKELLQDYCGNTPVGSPYNVDGSPATVTGFLSLSFRDDETEWLGMSDANNGSTVDTFECVTPGITAAEGADINIQATSAYIVLPVIPYHTQLGSTLNLLGTSSGNAMGSGVEIVSTGSSVQTVTFTVEVVNDSDPGSPDTDFGVCIIDNSTGQVIPANSITGPPLMFDAVGLGGLGYPIYNSVASGNTYTITWTGTIPVGSFTAVFTAQDQVNPGSEDSFNVQIVTPIVAGSSTTAQITHLDDCTIAALTAEPIPAVEIPGGLVIVNGASLPVIAGTNFVHSFSVKALFGSTYEISFDNGATWSPPIDGADSWGEGTIELVDVTNVVVRPSVNGMTTFVHWEI